jgi:hypothetical protein
MNCAAQNRHADWLNAQLSQAAESAPHRPTRCRRAKRLPSSAAEFARVRHAGVPTVFADAWKLFGSHIADWRDPAVLLRQYGETVHSASYFSTADAAARFGVQPSANGDAMLDPHRMDKTLREVLEFNRSGRLLVLEQSAFLRPDSGDPESPPLDTPLAAQFETPPWTRWAPLREANLWLGRVLPSCPKESPLHFDPDDNLMLQLRGEKTFLMYDAAQA